MSEIEVKEPCNNCYHYATCKYCEKYKESIDKLTEIGGYFQDSPIVIETSCKYFFSNNLAISRMIKGD